MILEIEAYKNQSFIIIIYVWLHIGMCEVCKLCLLSHAFFSVVFGRMLTLYNIQLLNAPPQGPECWRNPEAPVRLPGIERETCPFFKKVGACRFAER